MKYCLIEDFNSSDDLSKDYINVALTIDASYKLDKLGIKYILLEDFYKQNEICNDSSDYLESQINWFNTFDIFVKKLYPDAKNLNLDLPSLYYFNITYLIDQLVLTSKILNTFFDSTKPEEIKFISQVFDEDKFHKWAWFNYGESSYSRLVKPICEKRNIIINKTYVNNSDFSANSMNKKAFSILFNNIKQKLIFIYKNSKSFYNQAKINLLSGNYKKQKGKILIIKERDYIYDFAKDAKLFGFKLIFLNNKIDDKSNCQISNHDEKNKIIKEFEKTDIIKWLNEKCNLDVFPIINERIEYLLFDLFPKTIELVKKFINLYDKYDIDLVFNYSLFSKKDFAAAAAAKINNKIKHVGFFHGVDAYKIKHRFFMEFIHFDIYFASTIGEVKEIQSLVREFGYSKPIVNSHPYLINNVITKTSHKKNNQKLNTVLYLPIMRAIRINMPYDKTITNRMSYLKWHHAILKYFSSRSDYNFIWKAALQSIYKYDTMENIIQDQNIINVNFNYESLLKWIPKVDKVVCDVPSTAFFESCFAEVPVLGLYRPDEQQVRPDAINNYGSSLKPYSNIEEGINLIEEFLDGESESYKLNFKNNIVSVPQIIFTNK